MEKQDCYDKEISQVWEDYHKKRDALETQTKQLSSKLEQKKINASLEQLAKQGYNITDSKQIETEEVCGYIENILKTAPKGLIYFNNETKILSSYGRFRDSQAHLILPDLMISGSGGFNPNNEIFFYSPRVQENEGRASVRLPLYTKKVIIIGSGSIIDFFVFDEEEDSPNHHTIQKMNLDKWSRFISSEIEKKGVKRSHEKESIQIISYAKPIFLPNAKYKNQYTIGY